MGVANVDAGGKGDDASFYHKLCDPAPSVGCYVTFATPLAIFSIAVCLAAVARETVTARRVRVSPSVPWAAGAAMISNCVSSVISDPWLGSEMQGVPTCSIVATLLWVALLGACAGYSTRSASAPLVQIVMCLAVVGRVASIIVALVLAPHEAKPETKYIFFVLQVKPTDAKIAASLHRNSTYETTDASMRHVRAGDCLAHGCRSHRRMARKVGKLARRD